MLCQSVMLVDIAIVTQVCEERMLVVAVRTHGLSHLILLCLCGTGAALGRQSGYCCAHRAVNTGRRPVCLSCSHALIVPGGRSIMTAISREKRARTCLGYLQGRARAQMTGSVCVEGVATLLP